MINEEVNYEKITLNLVYIWTQEFANSRPCSAQFPLPKNDMNKLLSWKMFSYLDTRGEKDCTFPCLGWWLPSSPFIKMASSCLGKDGRNTLRTHRMLHILLSLKDKCTTEEQQSFSEDLAQKLKDHTLEKLADVSEQDLRKKCHK